MDYANATLNGLPDCDINKMQRIQNITAKMVLRPHKYSSPMECMKELHCFPIWFRIQHKVLTFVYKTLNGDAPEYMKVLLKEHIPYRSSLISGNSYKVLCIPHTHRQIFATSSFSMAGPTYLNALPEDIKKSGDVATFKQKLKTHLFKIGFNFY